MTRNEWLALYDQFGFILSSEAEDELMHGDWLENNIVEDCYIGSMRFPADKVPGGQYELANKQKLWGSISPGYDGDLITDLRRKVVIFKNARDAIAFKLKWT